MSGSKRDVFSELFGYYASLAEQLRSEARQARLLQNSTAVGTEREEIYRRFLERHVPKTCEVFRGGYVFNLQGDASKQTDVIVTAGGTPRFEMGGGHQAISPLEGTVAVAEIKSTLDKKKLDEALDNFASLPITPDLEKALSPAIKRKNPNWTRDWPYKIVFAFDAKITKDTLVSHVEDYYQNNKVRDECKPNIIHVLEKYAVVRMLPGFTVHEPDGSVAKNQPQEGDYHPFDRESDALMMPFVLESIRQNAFLASQMNWPYYKYGNRIATEILKKLTT